MSIYEEMNITPYINAHDTYTVYGGSRMSIETLCAVQEAAAHFVDIHEMQTKLGAELARLTHNEAAYITNGASGGLLLAAAVCMAQSNEYAFSRLPDTQSLYHNEVIVMRAQRNAYDKAIEGSGARIIEIGDADETLEFELAGSIGPKTAAVFYFASVLYSRGSMSLEKTIEIAHSKGIPVVVDAAAQLPPVENLWKFTQMGADMVIFSGGKTLCGPQDSGLIIGKKALIEDCVRFGAPVHGVCRSSKVSREAMAGLYSAVRQYLSMDHSANEKRLFEYAAALCEAVEKTGCARCEIVPYGPVGQSYPRAFFYLTKPDIAQAIKEEMYHRHIYIGAENNKNAVYISPLNLNEQELEIVKQQLTDVLLQMSV
ncbi:aminotransferase class V-fold PLP-dependent enzyme [Hydrogenoanaerobacterium sp.]|uniref:aminotransferase class V-fold PLP-dependent enzyme n=1 Tax=Hydrogenoanaerobacterium sp. TaxID=2953763 RepID=UPI00289C3794|nr:aminotransferase class V-fold PLP-dependent enzyme [Hydrogenoanaerobacterium sp.]